VHRCADSGSHMEGAYKNGGEKGFWQKHLELVLESSKQPGEYLSPNELAGAYAMADQTDKAFALLEKGYEAREGQVLTLLKCDPVYKNLRGDPRFSAMLRKIGLPDENPLAGSSLLARRWRRPVSGSVGRRRGNGL
jgi:hypothetical protein